MLAIGGFLCYSVYVQPLRPVVVHGHSMTPTYENFSLVWVNTRFDPIQIRRDDVVVFRHEGEQYIKRVAYLGNERILQIKGNDARDHWLTLFYPAPVVDYSRFLVKYIPIPKGTVFVLSDNPGFNTDSRTLGPIPLSEIEGVVEKSPKSPNAVDYDSPAVKFIRARHEDALRRKHEKNAESANAKVHGRRG